MQSRAADVDAYLESVPDGRQEAITRLRSLFVDTLVGYEESMEYGMPSYRRPGDEIEAAFASQARYISIYVMRTDVLDRYRERLSTNNIGKGCIRYGSPKKIDFDVLSEMLVASTNDDGPIC